MITLLNYSEEEWLTTLKPYQLSSIETLLKKDNEDVVVDIWLSTQGAAPRSPFGGGRRDDPDVRQFIVNFKKEFRDFICGGERYENERKSISTHQGDAKTFIISVMSSALAIVLGSSAAYLTPVIVVMLIAVSKMGVNAWCALENNS